MKEIISKRFKFVSLGHSFRATEMEAALGLSQLSRMDAIINSRKHVANRYLNGLSDLSEFMYFQKAPNGVENVYMLFGIVCKGNFKTELVNFLENNNIETRDLLPLTNQPIYKKIFGDDLEDKYPIAKMLNNNGFYIGCHQYITEDEIDYVISKFHEFFKK